MSSNQSLLGQYDFNQSIEINILADHEFGIVTTMIHEAIHLILTKNTDFGRFTSAISKLAVLMPKYKNSLSVLRSEMLLVQEGIAVFAEYYYLKRKQGDDFEFNKAIRKLEKTNREYYNYLKPLLFLFEYDNIEFENDSEIINLVKLIGLTSLNAPFPEIKVNQLSNPNKLKAYLKINEISPQKKYEMLLEEVKYKINSTIPVSQIFEEIYNRESEKSEQYEGKQQVLLDLLEDELSENQKYILKMLHYADTKYDRHQESPIDFASVSTMEKFPTEKIEFYNLFDKVSIDKGALYIKYVLYEKNDLAEDKPSFFVDFISISEQINFSVNNVSEDELHQLIDNTDILNGICCSPVSLCPKTKNLLGISRLPTRNIYVMFNISYAMTREFLEYFLDDISYEALAIDYGNFDVILMSFKERLPLLFPIFPDISQTFNEDNGVKFNIKVTPSDELFEKKKINENTISIVDSIINCVLQIRPMN